MFTEMLLGSNTVDDYVTEYGINIQAASSPQILNNEVYNMIYEHKQICNLVRFKCIKCHC